MINVGLHFPTVKMSTIKIEIFFKILCLHLIFLHYFEFILYDFCRQHQKSSFGFIFSLGLIIVKCTVALDNNDFCQTVANAILTSRGHCIVILMAVVRSVNLG